MDGTEGAPLPTSGHLNSIDMKQNRNHRPNRTDRRLRRMEDKLDIILCDLNRIHTRMNWLQSQIDSRNELEMDLVINRLQLAADRMKKTADKELQAVRQRYKTEKA